jgi:hypothetical protein
MADGSDRATRRSKWRPWLRALHRDLGYLAVGLTMVYALSGLAVNHIGPNWDPNFSHITRELPLERPLPEDDAEAAAMVQALAGIDETPVDVYRVSDDELEISFENRTLHVDAKKRRVFEEAQEPRFFLRAANWLHLNRGKKAWTWFADAYAIGLVVLACTGLAMIPGRKGFFGRGAVMAAIGVAVPLLYLALVGSP